MGEKQRERKAWGSVRGWGWSGQSAEPSWEGGYGRYKGSRSSEAQGHGHRPRDSFCKRKPHKSTETRGNHKQKLRRQEEKTSLPLRVWAVLKCRKKED